MLKFAGRRSLISLLLAFSAVVVGARGMAQVLGERIEQETHLGSPFGMISLHAEIIATGIPGAGAITQIGTFHKGGPFNDNATFKASTLPGRVLDRTRLLVASTSNFGAPLARPGEPSGAILSLNPNNGVVEVPPLFASGGGQAEAADGRVILYASQSPAFLNSANGNVSAATRDLPSVSLPLGISLNNGFGRPWFANAPNGNVGGEPIEGTITVTDPNGAPLAGAPFPTAGGVFAGDLTNRSAASTHGLTAAALATTLVTKSPDGTGRAVFLAALADGSVVQVHVAKGVDGLAAPGSFMPITGITSSAAESSNRDVVTRVGMLFNWVPVRTVFVTDPLANRILAFDLVDDGVLFQAVNVRYLRSPFLELPVDIAAAVPEVAARNFASNTILGGGSDFYVLNRGSNSIVRMSQGGKVLAWRRIDADAPTFRVNGITVSEDARTIWVTATVPGGDGIVLRMPTFGAGLVTSSLTHQAISAGANGAVAQGAHIFSQQLEPSQFVGPLFNGRSCNDCHNSPAAGGMGTSPGSFIVRVARVHGDVFDPLDGHGGPVARQRSIAELGVPCGLRTGIPPQANAISLRSAMTLRGTSLIDNIQVRDIEANRIGQPDALRGRFNMLADGRPGRFGWKAQTATLVEFMGEAFRDEIGSTNPLALKDLIQGCSASILKPEADAAPLTSLVAFLNTLDPPAPGIACLSSPGASLFNSAGCATCHRPSFPGPGGQINLYSDLLLHDMGAGLADGFPQGSATGNEFRTTPLWRVSDRQHFLHDGRATSILDAILLHGGQAAGAVMTFRAMSPADKQALLDFLGCI